MSKTPVQEKREGRRQWFTDVMRSSLSSFSFVWRRLSILFFCAASVPVQANARAGRKKKRRIERAINEVDVGWRCCFLGALFLSFFLSVYVCVCSPFFFDLLIYNPAPSDSNGAIAQAAGRLKIFTGTSAAAAA